MTGNALASLRNLTGSDLQHCTFMQNRAETWLKQGKFREAIEGLDQALRLQRRVFGEKNRDVLLRYKSVSKQLIQSLKLTHACSEPSLLVSLLLQWEKVLVQFNQSEVVPELCDLYTALAAAYRALTNFDMSKRVLLKAIRIGNGHKDENASMATVCLSLCATMNGLKEYNEALRVGKNAVKFAWEEMQAAGCDKSEKLSLLAVGFHNVGVQEEHLKNSAQAVEWYRKAVSLLEDQGSERHMSLLADLRKSLTDAQKTKHSRPQVTKQGLPLLNYSASSSPQRTFRKQSISKAHTPDRPKLSNLHSLQGLKGPFDRAISSRILSADHSYQPSLVSTPRDFGSDEDIRELEARGLLDYTMDNDIWKEGRKDPRRRRWQVRGRKRRGGGGREQMAVASTCANTPLADSENPGLHIEMPIQTFFACDNPAKSPSPLPLLISLFPSSLPIPLSTITHIQAVIRGFLARIKAKFLHRSLSHRGKLVYRHGKRFKNGTFGLVSLYESSNLIQLSVSVPTLPQTAWLCFLRPRITQFDQIVQYVEFDCRGKLVRWDEHQSAVMIQKVVRGGIDRRKCMKFKEKWRVEGRCGAKIGRDFVTASLAIKGDSRVLTLDGEIQTEITVPKCFAGVPLRTLIGLLHVHTSSISFSSVPPIHPPFPPAPLSPCPSSPCKSLDESSLRNSSVKDQQSNSIGIPNMSTAETVSPLFPNTESARDEEPAYRLAFQGVCDLGKDLKYAVMVYESLKYVKIKAFPQTGGVPIPKDLVVDRDDPRLEGNLDFAWVSKLIRVEDSGKLMLVAPSYPLSPISMTDFPHLTRCATKIQSYFRLHMTRLQRRWRSLTHCKLVYRGCKKLSPDTLDLIAIFREEERVCVEAKDVRTSERRKLLLGPKDLAELDLSPENGESLFDRLYCSKDGLRVTYTLLRQLKAVGVIQRMIRGVFARYRYKDLLKKSKRRLLLFSKKVINAEVFHFAIYESPDKIQIERFKIFTQCQLKYHSHCVSFPLIEIHRLYGKVPPIQVIFEDIVLTTDNITIRPRMRLESDCTTSSSVVPKCMKEGNLTHKDLEIRSIIRTSKRFGEAMWVVTMGLVAEGLLEFSAFSGCGEEPLRVQASLKVLAEKTNLPFTSIFPIGTVTIQRLLKIQEKTLVIDFNEETPDLNKLATLMQAYVRGFLVRRKVVEKPPKSNLLTCQVLTLNNEPWVLYAYRQTPWIDIKAYRREFPCSIPVEDSIPDSIFRNFPPSISNKRVIENFVFPKYSLEGNGPDIHFRTTKSIDGQKSILEKHKDKFRVISGTPGHMALYHARHSPRPKRMANSATQSPTFSPSNNLKQINSLHPSSAKASLVRKILSKDNVSLQIAPPVNSRANSHERTSSLSVDTSRKLMLKSTVELSGRTYQASMFVEKSSLLIYLVDIENGETIQRSVEAETDTELQCEQLINRIRIEKNQDGKDAIWIQDWDVQEEILYKRSHYISNRFYHVTIYRTTPGVRIEALDPTSKATLVLPLSLSLTSPAQRQLSLLMNRLEVISESDCDSLVLND